MPSHCPQMVAFTQQGKAKLVYCGKWACPHCAKANARKWAMHAHYGIQNPKRATGKVHFWTFTMPAHYKRPAQAYAELKRIWNTLRMAIQRDQKRFTFIAFVEGQPERSNMPHFHVLTFNTIPRGDSKRKNPLMWIKDFGWRVGFGFIAWDEIVTGRKAARYVSKYASKGCPEMPKDFHRVRCSRDWQKAPELPHDPYIVRSRNEPIEAYLLRVADTTGVPLQDIADAYQNTTHRLNQERLHKS